MPDPAIEGSLAIAADKLAKLVALCPTFQAGRSHAQTLAESVEWGYRETPVGEREPSRPFAVIDIPPIHNYREVAGGDRNYLRPDGGLFLYFELDWPADYPDLIRARKFAAGWVSRIVDELAEFAGRDVSASLGGAFLDGSGDLPITAISMEFFGHDDPDETPLEERKFAAGYSVLWGDG
jgi:hypothetical protein